MNDISDELNITNTMQNERLEYGEVNSYVDAEGDHRIQVGQYRYPLNDGTTVVLEIDRARNSIEHVYKQDEDGKLVPMCVEHKLDSNMNLSNEEQVIGNILNEDIQSKNKGNQRPAGGRDRAEEAYEAHNSRFME